ncbi:dockerin type I domain-containing protein [Paenibacillus segetis]|uniref:Dockerin domain-containing protein n=1 Tax=Paenibacillus segetis TaxID=1325360 RepID=A0ABQ1Y3C0_9BACL|nr:dockerin type I domain-containing protein [Paenibacillus segetis]GGH10446.1 hypothetical protein GCM10008013_01880 [Paenibacillus segetis]
MLNSKLKKTWRVGGIAALALLMVLQTLVFVPGPVQASTTNIEDMVVDEQIGDSATIPNEEPNTNPDDESVDDPNEESAVEEPTLEEEETDQLEGATDPEVTVTQTVYRNEPLFNHDFEMGAGSTVPGWSMFFTANDSTSYEVTQDVRYYGNSSLKLVDKSNTLPIYLQSDQRTVTPGYEYNGSAMMYIAPNAGNAAGASLVLRFYDETGKQVNTDKDGANIVHLRTVGSWTRVTVTGTAPANAVYARMAASISNYFTAESGAFYDDFTLTSPQEGAAPGTLHLQMPSGILANQQLEAKVLLSRGMNVQAVQGSLAYDPSVLEVINAVVADEFNTGGAATLDMSNDAGVLKFEVSKPEGSVVNDDKQVLNVTFRVLSEAPQVDVTLLESSGVQDVDAVENNKMYIGAADERSSTYIRRASLDVNGDGKVDLFDVMVVAKLVDRMVTNDNWMYDLNNDGRIDQADVVALTDAILSKLLN